jgi:ABC-type phosphate transport system substrate-binding protein
MALHRTRSFGLLLALAVASVSVFATDVVVVIGHENVKHLDPRTVARIYTGRVIEVDGVSVTAINAKVGNPVRADFLRIYLNQDEDKYTAYWTVRRYIGKGASPREFGNSDDIIDFITTTPGAIGYVKESDLRPGLNVLLR